MSEQLKKHLERRNKYLVPAIYHYFTNPPLLVKGKDEYLFDDKGMKYLDLCGGIGCICVGHGNEYVLEKVIAQMRELQHTSTPFLSEPMVALAEKLAELAPGKIQMMFPSNSGTEAIESAILMAKMATGSQELIALRHSYHGRSVMAVSVMGQGKNRHTPPYMPGVQFAANPYCYRCPYGKQYPSCELICATDIEDIIRSATSGKIAGFLAETVQGNGGIIVPPPEYFKVVEGIIKQYGGLMINDDVQAGMGRLGTYLFSIKHWGVEPDIIVMAKGLGNSFPIGATIATEEVGQVMKAGTHFSTFGGNPVASIAAVSTIEYLEKNNVLENAATVGAYFKEGLESLMERFPIIGDVRGMGLMLGFEMVKENKVPAVQETGSLMEAAKNKGLLLTKAGIFGNVVRLLPPLTLSKGQVDDALRIIAESLEEVTN